MIFVLAPLSLLAAIGIERLFTEGRRSAAVILAAALFGGAVFQNVHLFYRPRENWQTASAMLTQQALSGACIMLAPRDSRGLYEFFAPLGTECAADLAGQSTVALAVASYDGGESFREAQRVLAAAGFRKRGQMNRDPRVEIYRRD
jgi:hypothetical protein